MRMNYNNNDYTQANLSRSPDQNLKQEWRCPVSLLLVLLCVAIAGTMLLTFNITSNWVREQDFTIIEKQQQVIDVLRDSLENKDEDGTGTEVENAFGKLQVLAEILQRYSYYSNEFDQEQMLDEVMRAYTQATGDKYAAYYTEEEYAAVQDEDEGSGIGIGVNVVDAFVTVDGYKYLTFNIFKVFKHSSAASSGVLVGDNIYAIEVDGEFKTVEELGGYTTALDTVRGESGTIVKLRVFREDGNGGYTTVEFVIPRGTYTTEPIGYRVSESDATVGIVRIEEFNLQTPAQFKQAILALQEQGVEHFVFDVRKNPGGDLQSIKAVLSYLLNKGDLILTAIDNQGNYTSAVYAGAATYTGAYAPCSVLEEDVGMFSNLDMVILCDGKTASAAEVFTASLRDHKNVPIIGETTFGKGILQRYYSLAMLTGGVYDGYVKMTTHAYITECGVTYHGTGIAPTTGYEVALSEEAKEYNFYLLPENLDNQLQKAIEAVKN